MTKFVTILLLLVACFSFSKVEAQSSVNGVVLGKIDNTPIPGVNVIIKGSNKGTTTDIDGKFSLEVASMSDTLSFSSIGYKTLYLLPSQAETVHLEEDLVLLDDIVVTAIGISREKKSLGYAMATLDPQEIQQNRDPNFVTTLSGKVSGVQVSKTSGGPGSSSRVVIRGNSSLSGNNQALFVVDGIPIDNTTNGTGGMWGGIDYGSPISDLNPDDIESITVLKGPNAAALYGSRASNGVVVITTKSGMKRNGIGVSFNSSTSIETAYIVKEFQNEYGAGSNGLFEYNEDGLPFFNTSLLAKSWGPRMQDQRYVDWDGVTRTYSAQPDNYKDFFDVGRTFTNNLALEGGNETSTFRLSFTDLNNKGINPNTSFKRTSISLRGTSQLSEGFSADAKVNFVSNRAENRVNQSDGRGAGRNFNFMPRNVSIASLEDYKDAAGQEKVWYTPWAWQSNPYWVAYENLNEDQRNRMVGLVRLNYQITPKLSIMGRTGLDYYGERRNSRIGAGSFQNIYGDYTDMWINFSERNSDFLLVYNTDINENFKFGANFGGNRMYRMYEQTSSSVERLSVPNFYHPEFDDTPATEIGYNLSEKRINSLLFSAQLAYKEFLFVDVTGRNDWSSTLPDDHNSYFYPSVSTSWVFSRQLDIEGKRFSFGKIRTSWAQVGNDADPYQLSLTFGSNGSFNGRPIVGVNPTLPLSNLVPEITNSFEIGTDLSFFLNRLTIDATYYKAITKNQILGADVSSATGFSNAIINAGEIQNQGLEFLIQGQPIFKNSFKWNSTINLSFNRSEVLNLTDGLDNFLLGEQWGVSIEARPGQPYGDIVGIPIARDDNGNPQLNANGTFVKGEREVLGNVNPDWLMGVCNQFEYKRWKLGFLVDIKKGGDIYSASNMYAHGY
ncbi:MAG: SusC/RagA family TonB-linked outer membrane protein, partial [Flavobacteriales bacterium]